MRMLGLDIGDRRIGVALSDPTGMLAGALTVIQRKGGKADFQTILDLAAEHKVERIIVGLPRLMDGRLGAQAEKTLAFVEELSRLSPVPVETFDERLSTSVAEQLLKEAGKKRREIKAKHDAAAAALILQWYLDERLGSSPHAVPEGYDLSAQ